MREPRDGWTLDSEGSSRADEDTYDARQARARLERQARDARAKRASIIDALRRGGRA